jgi:hypothetical protein
LKTKAHRAKTGSAQLVHAPCWRFFRSPVTPRCGPNYQPRPRRRSTGVSTPAPEHVALRVRSQPRSTGAPQPPPCRALLPDCGARGSQRNCWAWTGSWSNRCLQCLLSEPDECLTRLSPGCLPALTPVHALPSPTLLEPGFRVEENKASS